MIPKGLRQKLGVKLFKDSTSINNNFINREDQLFELIKLLESNPDTYRKDVIRNDDDEVMCIMYIDTTLGSHYSKRERFDVYTKDVTWGVCDSASGLHKLSTIGGLTPDKKIRPLMFTLLTHETKDNFIKELEFFLKEYPWLELQFNRSSWFVDGDDQNIHAIEHLMPLAVITLCLFHLAGIILSRFPYPHYLH